MVLFLRAMLLHAMLLAQRENNVLFGGSLIEYAHVEQWMDFAATEVGTNIIRWYYPRLGYMPYIPASEEIGVAGLKRSLDALNTHLASNTFLVGHSVTLADIVVTCNRAHPDQDFHI